MEAELLFPEFGLLPDPDLFKLATDKTSPSSVEVELVELLVLECLYGKGLMLELPFRSSEASEISAIFLAFLLDFLL